MKINLVATKRGNKVSAFHSKFVLLTLNLVNDKFDQFCKPLASVFAAWHQFLTMKKNTFPIDSPKNEIVQLVS